MKTIQVSTFTADCIRAAAPALGLVASDRRDNVAPGIEAIHLPDFAFLKLDGMRKAAKISMEKAILRVIVHAIANPIS